MTAIPFDRVHAWLFDDALPYWADVGTGGPAVFRETCDLQTGKGADSARRVRVIARQVYAFSHAAMLGWNGPALERARAGVEFLVERVWQGPDKGWMRLLDANGDMQDGRADLYDFAFILFAFGWWMRASGDRAVEPYANQTLDLIERTMRHPSGRGHLHMLPAEPPYQQNPHMHLLEACLALDSGTGDPRWMAKAAEIASLFREGFYDSASGDLTEFFDAEWRADQGPQGRVVEPGHQLEWAWILGQYAQRAGQDFSAEMRGLVAAAEARGVSSRSGLVYGAVSKDGGVLESRHRIWPQTERIKGNLALFELTGEERSAQIASATNALLDRYLAPAPRGAWIDVLSEDGEPLSTDIPASTLYHLMLAFAELLRLRPALEAAHAR
jgi:N-acylglucosamine 2-epimerase/mannose-6-phosphate isomerase